MTEHDVHPPRDREYERAHQVIEKHYHTNGNGKIANDRINAMITGVAAAAITIVLGILTWQMQRVLDKLDDFGTRITRLEARQ